MYKVKRFSQIEQRSYGLLGDLRHSGLKRSYKKYVGRARRSIGRKLRDEVRSLENEHSRLSNLSIGIPRNESQLREVMNPKVSRNIIEKNSRKNKVRFMKSNNPYSAEILKSGEIDNDYLKRHGITNPRQIKKVTNAIKSNDRIAFLGSSYGKSVDTLAHEMGHAKNANSKNPIVRGIHKISEKEYIPGDSSDKGLYQIVRHVIKNKALVNEESRASKNAIKMMKKAGASKEELEQGRKNLNLALDTYKSGAKLDNSDMLYKTIQIPSRSDRKASDMLDEIRRRKMKEGINSFF